MEEESIEALLAEMARAVGRLVAKTPSGEVLNCGTCFGLSIDGVKAIATAEHVVKGLRPLGDLFLQVIPAEAQRQHGAVIAPTEYRLDADSAIRLREQHGVDVAVFEAPDSIGQGFAWLHAETHATATQSIREVVESEPPLPVLLFGFPRFARFKDLEARVERAGLFPLEGAIYRWPSVVDQRQVLAVDVEVPSVEAMTSEAGELGQIFGERLAYMRRCRSDDAQGQSVLGGYSGAPLLVIAPDRAAVIGLLTDGELLDWIGRAIAVPLNHLLTTLRRTSSWRSLADKHESRSNRR